MSSTCVEEHHPAWFSGTLLKHFLGLSSTRCRIVVALAIALICIAQTATYVDAQPLPERRALRGRVIGDNNLPVGGATVTVRRVGPGSAGFWGAVVYTDARGNFVVPDAEEGAYSVFIVAKNFARIPGKAYQLNESSLPLEAVLQRLASFTVRVQGNDGKPLVNAAVSILLQGLNSQTSRLVRGNSNTQGEIPVSDVVPARYSLYAASIGRGFDSIDETELIAGTRPDVVNLSLKEGGTLRLTAREATTGSTSSTGRTLGGATLTLYIKSQDESSNKPNLAQLFADDGFRLLTSDTDGSLEITDVPPGQYMAVLSHTSYSDTPREIATGMPREVMIKATETTAADFWLQRPANAHTPALRVLVQDAKSQPLVGASVSITLEQLSGAADINQAGVVGSSQRRARTDDKGEFELYPLTVGNWRLRLHGTSSVGGQNKSFVAPQPTAVKLGADGGSIIVTVH
jgi:uncharacterized GH25 family protein